MFIVSKPLLISSATVIARAGGASKLCPVSFLIVGECRLLIVVMICKWSDCIVC